MCSDPQCISAVPPVQGASVMGTSADKVARFRTTCKSPIQTSLPPCVALSTIHVRFLSLLPWKCCTPAKYWICSKQKLIPTQNLFHCNVSNSWINVILIIYKMYDVIHLFPLVSYYPDYLQITRYDILIVCILLLLSHEGKSKRNSLWWWHSSPTIK